MKKLLKIGISSRIVTAPNYDEKRDSISHDWVKFLEKIDVLPIIISNNLSDVKTFLTHMHLDGIILSGGDNIGDYILRDNTEKEIIEFSIENEIPVFGVCRGMQVINDFFGGLLIKTDDRNHVVKNHHIEIMNSKFNTHLGNNEIIVNSFHHNIIKKENLGTNLKPFAIDNRDKTIEGVFHTNYPILAVMWHPERELNSIVKLLIKKLFNDGIFWNR
jgi:N5-(cytidine 5'-diphosphoramidyl)-L-glutamine hydrolase